MRSDVEQHQQHTAERLRKASVQTQPPYDWLEFRRRAQIRAQGGQGRVSNALPRVAMAAAVSVLIIGGLIALLSHRGNTHIVVQTSPLSAPARLERDADAHTRVAERWLAALPPEPVIVRFGTRVAVTSLEDRIAQVDDLLTAASIGDAQPAHVAALREERGRLVNSLAQVRYAEALAANAP